MHIDTDSLNRPSDFSGLWESHWKNGRVRYRGMFREGKPIGQHLQFYDSGILGRIDYYSEQSIPIGTSMCFESEGKKDDEEHYGDVTVASPGSFVRENYAYDGKVFMRTTYVNYEIVDSWKSDEYEVPPELQAEIDDIVAKAVTELEEALGPYEPEE